MKLIVEIDWPCPPTRIPLSGGDEYDVFSKGWRHIHIWTSKPGACKSIKRKYNRRLRRIARLELTA